MSQSFPHFIAASTKMLPSSMKSSSRLFSRMRFTRQRRVPSRSPRGSSKRSTCGSTQAGMSIRTSSPRITACKRGIDKEPRAACPSRALAVRRGTNSWEGGGAGATRGGDVRPGQARQGKARQGKAPAFGLEAWRHARRRAARGGARGADMTAPRPLRPFIDAPARGRYVDAWKAGCSQVQPGHGCSRPG